MSQKSNLMRRAKELMDDIERGHKVHRHRMRDGRIVEIPYGYRKKPPQRISSMKKAEPDQRATSPKF